MRTWIRITTASMVAIWAAGLGIAVADGIHDALCATFERESIEWWWFGCWVPSALNAVLRYMGLV